MPYQCLQKSGNTLFAARGSNIDSFDIEKRSFLSSWMCPNPFQELKISEAAQEVKVESVSENTPATVDTSANNVSVPPTKKRKLSFDEETPEKKASNGAKKSKSRADTVASGLEAPAIIAMAVEGQHVVAVTGEDKSIRVFENLIQDGEQSLKQISQRAMPKRPCSLAITKHDSTIISADKFGDVYSLPLLFTEKAEQEVRAAETKPSAETPEPPTAFVPSANHLTVHSQRNRKALAHQKRSTNKPSEKVNPTFEHKLLLGHVSMLTDVILANMKGHNYIITADRDEHIRISRGIPQSHIIEGFCLGHTEFITRICIPDTRPSLLISGGGDDDLYLWEWETGTLLSRTNLKGHVESEKIAISNILHVTTAPNNHDLILVTCEGIPAIFTYTLTDSAALQHTQTLKLHGNVLSMIPSNDELIVSIDTFHKPGSTTERRDSDTEQHLPLETFIFQEDILTKSRGFEGATGEELADANLGKLSGLLYSLENLRKREDAREEDV